MGTTTLTAAHLVFKAHRDGKDADSVLRIKLTNITGIGVASADLTNVAIGDDEVKPVDMTLTQLPFSAVDALEGSLNITGEFLGHDIF